MSGQYLEENKWWVSPYNFVDEVTGQFDLPHKVEIHDATLRDGEQTPGVVFRKDDKVRIAEMLDEVGVERIEAGMPAVSEEPRYLPLPGPCRSISTRPSTVVPTV